MVMLILRIIGIAAAVVFLGFFVIPMTHGIINPGNIAGTFLCLWLLCVLIPPVHGAIKAFCFKHLFTKIVFRVVNIGFIAFAVYGAIVTSAMVWATCQAPPENSTAIVLGAQVKPWGPSVILRGRIDAAKSYLDDSPNANAVLSGGQGSDEIMSEAQCMYNVLTESKIDSSRLYMEDKSTNTTENIRNSMKIIEDNNLNTDITIVTDGFHQLRARIICSQLGIKGNVGAVSSDTRLLMSLLMLFVSGSLFRFSFCFGSHNLGDVTVCVKMRLCPVTVCKLKRINLVFRNINNRGNLLFAVP